MSRSFAFILLLVGCSSASDTPTDETPVGELLGTFQVKLVAPTDSAAGLTSILGKIYDGAQPETVIWETAATDGGCTLYTPRVPFCATPCGATAACVEDDTCQAYPTSRSVGTVKVSGVATTAGAETFTLTAVANSYQPPSGTALAYPPFEAGDEVRFEASGSDFAAAFALHAPGVAPLEVANASSLALAASTAFALAWDAGDEGSTVHVKLDISHHGGSKGKIECDVADTGALTLSAAMVDQLLGLGAAGYPSIIVTREAVGHAAIATGHVDLVVSSEVEAPIAVPGVTSCTEDTDCVSPATCQSDLTCR